MGNIITTVIWTVVGAAVVGVIGSLIFFLSKKSGTQILKSLATEVNEIKFSDIVAFFKNPSCLEKLKKQKHLVATVIKEVEADGTIFVQAFLYDDEKEKIVDIEESHLIYKSKRMDEELTKNFGEKDMIILN